MQSAHTTQTENSLVPAQTRNFSFSGRVASRRLLDWELLSVTFNGNDPLVSTASLPQLCFESGVSVTLSSD